ncbi:MAG: hypothetical protein JXA19_04840 [Anaerolineales bacterium]|nr:hypothetical protein [Anaerolineales bacterium]
MDFSQEIHSLLLRGNVLINEGDVWISPISTDNYIYSYRIAFGNLH